MRRTKMPTRGRTRLSLSLFPVCLAIAILVVPIGFAAGPAPDVLLNTMQNELKRAGAALGKSEPPAYYLSYSVADVVSATLAASNGAIYGNTRIEERPADVIMRVGSEALDNTHGQYRASGVSSGVLPLTDNPDATARILWQLTSNEYERASSSFLQVKTNQQVQAAEEDKSPDFSNETPQHHPGDATKPSLTFDQNAWAARLKRLSADFLKYPDVYTSYVTLSIQSKKQYFANTEGTAVVEPSSLARLVIEAETRADDGMDLFRVETFQEDTADKLPSDAELQAKIEKMATDVKALRNAPTADAYAGPAMLSGRAAAVFFHEVLGHRLEGHRQRGDSEGQTFTKQINKLVMPSFITVTDDPTIKQLNGIRLSGTYQFDDEGVPAQRVVAVDNGVLKNFLMSRMPNQNFSQSNGHGRSQIGLMPTGRQGNLLVTSTNTVSEAELRKRFIDEIKKQGKTYGLYFDDIEGGFTLTSRGSPQAFEVLPILVYRVYADGRPDELVRGVDIVGTPLVALNSILVTGDKEEVFNGICGAESGQIPVSAAAPAMLFSELEVQKAATGANRPPILAPPEGESFSAISAGGSR
ncbi:MAG TPA: metallopeptidase TldD-related protein [Candidatus Acidoferrales bacterium]